jgi:hypothetical protein
VLAHPAEADDAVVACFGRAFHGEPVSSIDLEHA